MGREGVSALCSVPRRDEGRGDDAGNGASRNPRRPVRGHRAPADLHLDRRGEGARHQRQRGSQDGRSARRGRLCPDGSAGNRSPRHASGPGSAGRSSCPACRRRGTATGLSGHRAGRPAAAWLAAGRTAVCRSGGAPARNGGLCRREPDRIGSAQDGGPAPA